MTGMLGAASRWFTSLIGSGMLIVVATVVSICGLGLAALYMVDHVQETPGMKKLRCFIAPTYADCTDQTGAMDTLRSELAAMAAEHDRLERQLAGLRAIEAAVDTITLFKSVTDPASGIKVMVGTVYEKFVGTTPQPESYFCYLQLTSGPAGEDRTLYFQGTQGPRTVSPATLKKTGVSEATLAFGRSVCQPQLIGAGS